MTYRREIDGLRALAVLPVMLFHAGFESFSGGFVGVDVFFVISGYLITTIIIGELQQDQFSIVNFYERRARRILPALFLVMLVCLPFAWIRLLPNDMKDFTQSLVAVSVFASNILLWRKSGYFDTAAEFKPLLHTWSLAVEEQYYVLFPLLLMLCWKLGKGRIAAVMAAVLAASLAVAQWASTAEPVAAFYLLPTRGWELLLGAFAALYLSEPSRVNFSRSIREVGGWSGLALLAASILTFSKTTPFPGVYALAPTLGTVLIILFATQETTCGKFVGNKAFVGIGLLSYSAYLWHQPLFAFARHWSLSGPSPLVFAGLFLSAFGIAFCSWKYVEAPFRNKQRVGRRPVFILAFAFSTFFVMFGLVGHASGGFKTRLPSSAQLRGDELPKIDNGWCLYSVETIPSLKVGADGLRCVIGDAAASTRGILFGDSFAGHYEPLWDSAGRSSRTRITAVTTNWCFPSVSDEFTGPRRSRAFDQCLFNRAYLRTDLASYDFAALGGNWGDVLSKNQLEGTLDLIGHLAGRLKVVVIMAAPKTFDRDPLNEYRRSIWRGHPFDIAAIGSSKDGVTAKANQILKARSLQFKNVIFVDRNSLFTLNGQPSDVTDEGIPYSLDGGHISIYGSLKAAKNFVESSEFGRFMLLIQ